MDDSNADYETLCRAIDTMRAQLTLLSLDDPRRDSLYRDLLRCYHEAFALLYARIAPWKAARNG